jgi:hypothetical protein
MGVKTVAAFAPRQDAVGKIVSYSSFAQIPKQIFDAYVKIGKAFHEIALGSFSNGEMAIKASRKTAKIGMFFGTANLRESKSLKISYAAAPAKYAGNVPKNIDYGLFFKVFGILQLLLCLLAIKKANLPYAIAANKIQKTRYCI